MKDPVQRDYAYHKAVEIEGEASEHGWTPCRRSEHHSWITEYDRHNETVDCVTPPVRDAEGRYS